MNKQERRAYIIEQNKQIKDPTIHPRKKAKILLNFMDKLIAEQKYKEKDYWDVVVLP